MHKTCLERWSPLQEAFIIENRDNVGEDSAMLELTNRYNNQFTGMASAPWFLDVILHSNQCLDAGAVC
jgi:hypothetical protein